MDFLQGKTSYTPRLLLSLIEQFPEGSATGAALRDDPHMRYWDLHSELLAAVHNAVQINTMVVGGVSKKDRDKFEFLESPATKKAKGKGKKSGRAMNAKALKGLVDSTMDALPDHLRMSKQRTKDEGD